MKKDIAASIEEIKGKKTVDPKSLGIPAYTPKKGKETVKDVELRYLPLMYQAWEKVQSVTNALDRELNLRKQPKELMHFDFACSMMEQAFDRLEKEIKERKEEE